MQREPTAKPRPIEAAPCVGSYTNFTAEVGDYLHDKTRRPCRGTAVRLVLLVGQHAAQFGQSGTPEDLYRYNGIDADSIVRAALDLAG